MSFNPSIVDNPWEFEDQIRRASQRLFDTTLTNKRQERNRQYRIGLLTLLDGLMSEAPFDISEGMERIAAVFPNIDVPPVLVKLPHGAVPGESE